MNFKIIKGDKVNFKKYIIFVVVALIVAACATPVPPSGGPKDITPPVVLNYNPHNNSLGIKSNSKVKITFDEYVVLSKLNEQLIVSPPVKKMPEILIKGKKVEIILPDSLEENTTYNIFFGDAVQNFKENLPIQNFSYSFSTGMYVDSLQIIGKVLNAIDLKPIDGALVILYKDSCDTVGLYQKPYYVAKSRVDGTFRLQNLSFGKYRIFGIKDLNSNYIYDQPDEEIAFKTELIEPEAVISYPDSVPDSLRAQLRQNNLYMYKEDFKQQAIVSSGAFTPNKIQVITRNPLKNPKFRFLKTDSAEYFIKPNENADTSILWLKNVNIDTLLLEVSDQNMVIDTTRIYLSKVKKADDSTLLKSFLPTISIQGQQAFFSPIFIDFPLPIQSQDFSSVSLLKSNAKEEIPVKVKCTWIDSFPFTKLKIDASLEERENYKLVIPMGAFTSIYGNFNDTLRSSFTTTQSRNYGSLKLKITGVNNRNLIIQLLSSSDKVVDEQKISNDTSVIFPYLAGANYKVKAIEDLNQNGKWDKGKYSLGILPERVFYLRDIINVRTNWDINWKWILE